MRAVQWRRRAPTFGHLLLLEDFCFARCQALAPKSANHTIEELPEGATWADVQERINFVAGVRKGLRELDEGMGIPHDRVKEEFAP